MQMNNNTVQQLRQRLVISCQASPGDPLEDTDTLRRIAQAVVAGGAEALRLNSAADIAAIRQDTQLPIIGIQKAYHEGMLRITPDFASAEALARAGASVIALDCTDREHAFGEPWREIVRRVHDDLHLPVMADIATFREGVAASEAGADLIGTTLNGYTAETAGTHAFDWQLLRDLVQHTGKAIVAEGHIATPHDAARAIEEGAWCVVVGSAVTRPGVITSGYRQAFDSMRSRPAVQRRHVVALDIGGTSIKSAVVNDLGEATLHDRTATMAAGGRSTIERAMHAAIQGRLANAASQGIVPSAIGIASAGAIDAVNGRVFAATENLPGWAGFDIRGSVRTLSNLPVFVENDAHAAALAELHFGAGRGVKNFVALTVGTGVGGGVVMDGKLQRGRYGFAGTAGHQTIRFDGRQCNCGRGGCLEAYVSAAALVSEYDALTPDHPSKGQDAAAQSMYIAEQLKEGDPTARQAYRNLAGYLAEGLANIFNLFDPEMVILSGGLLDPVLHFEEELQRMTQDLLHFGTQRPPVILRATAGHTAGLLGAAAAAFDGLRQAGH